MKHILHKLITIAICAFTLCAYGIKGSLWDRPPTPPDGYTWDDGYWQFIPGKQPYGVELGDWIWINNENNGFKMLIEYNVTFDSDSENHSSEIFIKKIKIENEVTTPSGITLSGTMSTETSLNTDSHSHSHTKKEISRTSTSVTYMEYCDAMVTKSCMGSKFIKATNQEDLNLQVATQLEFIRQHIERNRKICNHVHKTWTEGSSGVCLICHNPLSICGSCGNWYCIVCDNHVCGTPGHSCYDVTCSKCGLTYCPICTWHDIDKCQAQESDSDTKCDCPCHESSKSGKIGDGNDWKVTCGACGHAKWEHD